MPDSFSPQHAPDWVTWLQGGMLPPVYAGAAAAAGMAPPGISSPLPPSAASTLSAAQKVMDPQPSPDSAMGGMGANPQAAPLSVQVPPPSPPPPGPEMPPSPVPAAQSVSGLYDPTNGAEPPTAAPAPPPRPQPAPQPAQQAAAAPPTGPVVPPGTAPMNYAQPPADAPDMTPQGIMAAAAGAPAVPPPGGGAVVQQSNDQGNNPLNSTMAASLLHNYSTIAAPPPDIAPLIDAAAEKYHVPPKVLQWVLGHESNYGKDTSNGIMTSTGTAKGIGQFMDETAKQYGVDVTNNASGVDGAAHYLADLAAKNGGDWTKAVQSYGTFSTGQGSARDQLAKDGFQTAIGASPSAPSAPASPTPNGTWGGDDAANGTMGGTTGTGSSINLKDLLSQMGVQSSPSTSDKMLALGSGLLSSGNFNQALSAGTGNVLKQDQEFRENALRAAPIGVELSQLPYQRQLAMARLQMQQAQLGRLRPVGTPVVDPKSPSGYSQQFIGLDGRMTTQPTAGPTAQQQRVDNSANPALQGAIATAKDNAAVPAAAAKDAAAQGAKANQASVSGVIQDGQAAGAFLHTNQTLSAAINGSQGIMGPGLLMNIKRQVAEAFPGLDIGNVSSADMGVMKKNIAALTQSQVAANKSSYGSRITNTDLAQIQKLAPQMDTDPNAARTILSLLNQGAQQKFDLWQKYNADPNKAQWNQSFISQQQGGNAQALLDGGGATRNADGTWSVGASTVKFH